MNGICEKCLESAQQAVALRDVQRDFDARLLDAQGARITDLEAALRQCVDALKGCLDYGSMTGSEHIEDAAHDALVACEEALK